MLLHEIKEGQAGLVAGRFYIWAKGTPGPVLASQMPEVTEALKRIDLHKIAEDGAKAVAFAIELATVVTKLRAADAAGNGLALTHDEVHTTLEAFKLLRGGRTDVRGNGTRAQ